MYFEKNMGTYLSIDEVALSKGELYTIISNKAGKGKEGTIIASVAGTKADDIIEVLRKIPISLRKKVVEVTLDMAANMTLAVKLSFPMAKLVTDRFHVIRLGLEALQHLRTQLRWKEMDIENDHIKKAKLGKVKFEPIFLSNGDTAKQLLSRSRYTLAKKEMEWTENQRQRAELLFSKYPQLEMAYKHVIKLRNIYEHKQHLDAITPLKEWIELTRNLEIKEFNSVANSIENHFETILNFFYNRSTNANAESFNSKIKLFRANLRGVVDTKFFLFRLATLFA
jgi:transposase